MFYVYERSSTFIMGKMDSRGVVRADYRKTYKTMAAAKAAITRFCVEWYASEERHTEGTDSPNNPIFRYAVADCEYFHLMIEKSRRRSRLLDPTKEFDEPVNTPAHMSPATETYWSM